MSINMMDFKMQSDPNNTDTAAIYIYDVVGASYKDTASNTSTAKKFKEMLDSIPNAKNLNIHVNSSGGSCADGVAIYSMIKAHKANKTAYVDGYACSIASLIVAACDKVVMSIASAMQIHSAWTFAYGNARTMRATASALDKITAGIKQAYLERSDKLDEKTLDELITGEDGDGTWLTADECLKYGLCDEISGKSQTQNDNKPQPEPEPNPQPENKLSGEMLNTFRAFFI